MNVNSHESERVAVSLETVWRALTALGHQRLWLRPPDASVKTWLILTWDGLTVAERIRASGIWWLTVDVNAIYTNPEGIFPDGLEELTWLSVQRRMADGF
ncbi:TPA: hypothetical protein ACTYTR_005193 [Klebsiella michiganensis]|jgi:hypothetical protein|uniref:hypothetical protein n=1 Tax=Enterobacter roggenkampii TaxID=1812935 RepID=UPI00064A5E53|nr:hypothetical protein [Enterobacter roggenkampii]EME1808902.1 hypothetical protein [Cronobacter sakazakii]KLP31077.1 hypothetical protein YA48_09835 [Enterobacter roggenkampii]HAV1652604.1 hypothetical protein [Enterobacter hormaechei subsp. xiangfangensis]